MGHFSFKCPITFIINKQHAEGPQQEPKLYYIGTHIKVSFTLKSTICQALKTKKFIILICNCPIIVFSLINNCWLVGHYLDMKENEVVFLLVELKKHIYIYICMIFCSFACEHIWNKFDAFCWQKCVRKKVLSWSPL